MRATATSNLRTVKGLERSRVRVPLVIVATALTLLSALVATLVLGPAGPGSLTPMPAATPVVDANSDEGETELDPTNSDDALALSAVPVVTYEVFLSRDPFEPVVPEVEEPVATTDPSDPADPTDPDRVVDPTDPDSVSPLAPVGPGERHCRGDTELVCDSRVVTLLETTEVDGVPVAVIQVGSTVYEVRVGETFANAFVLLAIDGDSVTILYGDETNVLQPGHSVLK